MMGASMPELYGISALLIAGLVGVHPDTARRWKRAGRVPAAVRELLRLRLDGDLGLVDPRWSGFRLVRGELFTPEGDRVGPGDIRAIPFRRQQLAELQRLALDPRQWELF
jgi:hypothetical protein